MLVMMTMKKKKKLSNYTLLVSAILRMTAMSLLGLVFAGQSPGMEAFTFVQLCDPQLGIPGPSYEHTVASFRQAVRRINALKPDFVVLCGDYIHSAGDMNLWNDQSMADFKRIKHGLAVPSYCAAGNNDIGNAPTVASLNRYREAIGKDYYSFEHKGYTFVIANTQLWTAPLAGESETHDAWFKQTLGLAREKDSPIFVVQHHPLYYDTPDQLSLPLAKRNELLVLFEERGVVAVLAGHSHTTIVNEHKGIQLVSGETTSRNFDGRPLGFRLWQVDSPVSIRHEFIPLTPGVDFDGDKRVDMEDLWQLAQDWLHDEPSVDIAPGPYGDERVDFHDLAVFARYWHKDFSLLAHWRLDETEGSIAQDSAIDHNGALYGAPAWRPTAGAVDGTLEFDGIDDYISAPHVLNPADSEFSVFAWVKGGAPGQVIISQRGTVNWLLTDLLDGSLKTELKSDHRREGQALTSPAIITDGDWHHIGLTWDSANRALYVDDIVVAEDAQPSLRESSKGLYIGAGKDLSAGSFWSGLIDDVWIYDRVVEP